MIAAGLDPIGQFKIEKMAELKIVTSISALRTHL